MRGARAKACLLSILTLAAASTAAAQCGEMSALRAAVSSALPLPADAPILAPSAAEAFHRFRVETMKSIEQVVAANGSANSTAVRSRILKCLAGAGVVPRGAPGTLAAVEVKAEGRGFFVVNATFAMPCGSDSALLLFRREGPRNVFVTRIDSGYYRRIDRAFGNLAYVVLPDEAGATILFATIAPWCDSNWQELRVRAVRPGAEGQTEVLDATDTVYTGLEEPWVRLSRGSKGVEVSYASVSDFGGEPEVVRKIVTYSVGKRISRAGERIEREPDNPLP
jgi:hypothetical protein